MHKLKNRQQEDDIFVLLHLVWSNFGCGVILECSTLFLVTSAIDIHRNLLAIRIWVTERNCSSRYIHSNILILWILVSSNKISVSLNALHYDLVLWRESARALFCQPEFATYETLHAYSSIIGPSAASQMQNKSVFKYFFCNASYTPTKAV